MNGTAILLNQKMSFIALCEERLIHIVKMRKSYKFKKRVTQEKSFRYNQQIKVPEVLVIDEEGNHLGVMSTQDAISRANDVGLDLVEVSPVEKPPVTKIMNFGSFKYQKEKLQKKQKQQSKSKEVKSVRLSMKIGDHDRATKQKQAHKFLEKGHKIKIELILRGREMRHINLAKDMVREFTSEIELPVQVEQDVTKQGNKLFIILIPENN